MGFSRAARRAGRKPKSTPMPTEMLKATATEPMEGETVRVISVRTIGRMWFATAESR